MKGKHEHKHLHSHKHTHDHEHEHAHGAPSPLRTVRDTLNERKSRIPPTVRFYDGYSNQRKAFV